ncbi:unnamed protein product, partial [Phaeothamnion confervicola]
RQTGVTDGFPKDTCLCKSRNAGRNRPRLLPATAFPPGAQRGQRPEQEEPRNTDNGSGRRWRRRFVLHRSMGRKGWLHLPPRPRRALQDLSLHGIFASYSDAGRCLQCSGAPRRRRGCGRTQWHHSSIWA